METIFIDSGSKFSSSHSTIIVGVIQMIVVSFSALLVDKWGRKVLLVISCAGCSISMFVLGVYFYMKDQRMDVSSLWLLPIATVITFTVSFKFGLGSLPWTLVGELFSSQTKSVAATITTTVCVSLAFATTFLFPTIKEMIGYHGSFWIFSGNALIACLFSLFYIPSSLNVKDSVNLCPFGCNRGF